MLAQLFASKKAVVTLIGGLIIAALAITTIIVRPDLAETVLITAISAVTGLGGVYSISQGGVDKAAATAKKAGVFILVGMLLAGSSVGCTQPFERSQQIQIQVMKQLREEMDAFRGIALSQMRKDKGDLIDMAFRWDLADAAKDGQVPLQFVLTKDQERKGQIAKAEASISSLNRDFEARWVLFSKGISLGEATYDVLSQWTRTGKALEGVFTTLPEVHAAAEKAMAPNPEPPASSLPALESAATEPPIAIPAKP